MDYGIQDKVVVLTGAAGGFGRALTKAFLAAGAKVAAHDVDAGRLAALAAEHDESMRSGRLRTFTADVGSYDACEAAVRASVESLGPVDVLINNGAMGMGVIRADHLSDLVGIDEVTPEVWERFAAVNFSGPWYMTKCVIGPMRERGWGRIITVTTSFFTMLRGRFHPYGPGKAGLEAMCAGLADELAGTGVTVNVVVPGGPSNTPMVPEEEPFDRSTLVQPEQMCPPMLWLCSPDADDVNGNRYIAANWDAGRPAADAAAASGAPIGWPDLVQTLVWPGAKPDR